MTSPRTCIDQPTRHMRGMASPSHPHRALAFLLIILLPLQLIAQVALPCHHAIDGDVASLGTQIVCPMHASEPGTQLADASCLACAKCALVLMMSICQLPEVLSIAPMKPRSPYSLTTDRQVASLELDPLLRPPDQPIA